MAAGDDPVSNMLSQRAFTATLWSGADVFLRQGLQFAITVALARMVSPEQFGTVALLYLFIGIAGAFVDSGFSAALTQRREVSRSVESTVFWFNLAASLLVAVLLCASAPLVARFYGIPRLVSLILGLAVTIPLNALGSIHATLLSKNLQFRAQMKIGAVATLVAGAGAILLALRGYGEWALVAQALLHATVTTALLWVQSEWRPLWIFDRVGARSLFTFGGYLLAAGLLDIFYSRFYTLLIGKAYGARELGFYNRALSTQQMPVSALSTVLGRVALPVLSEAASDTARLRRGTQLALRGVMFFTVPTMLGLAAVAEPLVLTLFGARWQPAVPILRILCLGGMLWPLHVINLNALMAQGHSQLFLRVEVLKKAVGTGVLLYSSMFGLLGIAWGQVAAGVVAFLINAHYTKRHLDYGALMQTREIAPALAISVPMALGTYWLADRLVLAPAAELALLVAVGVGIHGALAWAFRLGALQDATQLLRTWKAGRARPG